MSGSPPKATTSASESSSPTNVGEEPFPPFFGTPAVPNPPLFCPDYSGHSENSLFLELQQSQQRFLEDLVAIQEGDVRDSHGQSFFVVEPRLHDAVLLHERGDVRSTTRRSLSDPGLCHLLGDTSPHRYDHLLRRDPSPPRLTSPNMAQAPDNTPKPKEVSPPTLADVDPIKWVTFSKQFTRVASLNNWDSKRSKLLLHTCMQDAAARAVEHIEFDDALSLDEAIKQFAKIFVNPASTQLYKTKFKDASRQPGEELILWHTRAREMFMRAYPNITDQETNEDLKERFVLGLRNRQLSHSLLSAENYSSMTFTELLTRSRTFEAPFFNARKLILMSTRFSLPPLRTLLISPPFLVDQLVLRKARTLHATTVINQVMFSRSAGLSNELALGSQRTPPCSCSLWINNILDTRQPPHEEALEAASLVDAQIIPVVLTSEVEPAAFRPGAADTLGHPLTRIQGAWLQSWPKMTLPLL